MAGKLLPLRIILRFAVLIDNTTTRDILHGIKDYTGVEVDVYPDPYGCIGKMSLNGRTLKTCYRKEVRNERITRDKGSADKIGRSIRD